MSGHVGIEWRVVASNVGKKVNMPKLRRRFIGDSAQPADDPRDDADTLVPEISNEVYIAVGMETAIPLNGYVLDRESKAGACTLMSTT